MDSREQNDLKARRREEALARRVGEALDRLSPHAETDCPDASLLAGYHERALDAQELAHWDGHFAACSRCRRILAVLAAGSDAPLKAEEVERFGSLVRAAREHDATVAQPQATEIKPIRPRFADWRWRWLAPALGAAAAAALWFAVWPVWRAKRSGSENVLIAQQTTGAQQTASAPALTPESKVAENSPARTTMRADDKNASSAKKLDEAGRRAAKPSRTRGARADQYAAAAPPMPAPPPAKPALNSVEKTAPQSRDAVKALKAPSIPAPSGVVGGVAGGLAEPGNAPGSRQARVQAAPAPSAESQKEESRATPPSVASTAPQPSEAEVAAQDFAAKQKAQTDALASSSGSVSQTVEVLTATMAARKPLVVLKAPGEVQWRAGALGWIARSTDGGRTWKAQKSPGQEMWLAGAAPAENVCWLAGMNGAIARTTDGEHWEKILPPPAAADANGKFPEWLDISASDASHATITARDQRSFSTSDGGKTWSPHL